MKGEWFAPLERHRKADVQLFAFPHAGGGPASLSALLARLPSRVELWSLNLPGRQARLNEPARTDMEPLVAELADDLPNHVRRPFALFGYCSGALLAYLVARRLDGSGTPPSRLLVGSFA